jgi:hypothetical protein
VENSAIARREPFGDERVIRSLSGRTGMPAAEIRTLFSQEFARLQLSAKVRSYLPALTAANVRALLRSAGALTTEALSCERYAAVKKETDRLP